MGGVFDICNEDVCNEALNFGETCQGIAPLSFGPAENVYDLAEQFGNTAGFGNGIPNLRGGIQGLQQLWRRPGLGGALPSIAQPRVLDNQQYQPTNTAAPLTVQVYSTTTHNQQPLQLAQEFQVPNRTTLHQHSQCLNPDALPGRSNQQNNKTFLQYPKYLFQITGTNQMSQS